jgi:hypothetical protein
MFLVVDGAGNGKAMKAVLSWMMSRIEKKFLQKA